MKILWATSLVLLLVACRGSGFGPVPIGPDAAPPIVDAAVDAEVQPEAAVTGCGNGVLDPSEDCDGPQNLGGMDCLSLGYDDGILACADCRFDTAACTWDGPFCGDGVINSDEACDGADHSGLDCEALGFDFGELHCTATCRFDTSDCGEQPLPCGDGTCDWQGIETIANCPEDCGCDPVRGIGCAANEACVMDGVPGAWIPTCILAGTTTYLCSPFNPCAAGWVCATPQYAQYCDHADPFTCAAPQTCQGMVEHNGYQWGYCLD